MCQTCKVFQCAIYGRHLRSPCWVKLVKIIDRFPKKVKWASLLRVSTSLKPVVASPSQCAPSCITWTSYEMLSEFLAYCHDPQTWVLLSYHWLLFDRLLMEAHKTGNRNLDLHMTRYFNALEAVNAELDKSDVVSTLIEFGKRCTPWDSWTFLFFSFQNHKLFQQTFAANIVYKPRWCQPCQTCQGQSVKRGTV